MANDVNETVFEILELFKEKMEKTLNSLKVEFQSMRAGRANPHILDKVVVDYYGTPTKINEMANVSISDARCLVISVWDASMLKAVEKAIMEANVGIHPNNDGKVIRLVFPELTEERRKDLVKQVKKAAEDTKVALRNERREALDSLKKLKTDKVISEDEFNLQSDNVEKPFAKMTESVDAISKEKEKELMSV